MSRFSFNCAIGIALVWNNSCSQAKPDPTTPPLAHTITSEGSPVANSPEPEVVQLLKVEEVGDEKHVTLSNVAGEYVLVCNEDANKKDFGIKSCMSPQPHQNYLLFRQNSKWLRKGAKEPLDLAFMQDFSVIYNRGENIGLMPANSDGEYYGVYWLLSWQGKTKTK